LGIDLTHTHTCNTTYGVYSCSQYSYHCNMK